MDAQFTGEDSNELETPAPSGAKNSNPQAVSPGTDIEEREKLVFVRQADAPNCSECGNIMVRNGNCYKCTECGSTSGCG